MNNAALSPCGTYRYSLRRSLFLNDGQRAFEQILWVMLNPSTADATLDDPTIRRCLGFSKAWGFGDMVVVNLYAFRATDPKQLHAACAAGVDVVGPQTDDHIHFYARCSEMTVCAWGRPGPLKDRAERVRQLLLPHHHRLTLNKNGHPGHPLYLPKHLKPEVWP